MLFKGVGMECTTLIHNVIMTIVKFAISVCLDLKPTDVLKKSNVREICISRVVALLLGSIAAVAHIYVFMYIHDPQLANRTEICDICSPFTALLARNIAFYYVPL